MSDQDEVAQAAPTEARKKRTGEGQVSLTQMLKALDKDVATGIEKRLKKLSKKKAVTAPLDEHKVAQMQRREAYADVSKAISKWDPIVERNRSARQLSFPLDIQPDVLPNTTETLDEFHPRNDLEKEVQKIIEENKVQLQKEKELTKAEERYQKAISIEEAKERHKELQKMRVKLSSFAAKMRRQNSIKSKSYRRLLKHERIKNHMKRVESNQDALLDEIERLQKLRAQERASLKHKNTGKWAKHAKFRAKYDEKARNEMLEQIGIARKLLDKPVTADSEESDEDDDEGQQGDDDDYDDGEEISDVSDEDSADDDEQDDEVGGAPTTVQEKQQAPASAAVDRLIVSTELINDRAKRKRKSSGGDDVDEPASGDDVDDADDDEEEDEQRRLMSEAFAEDDVVGEFKKSKARIADEEQPKDIDLYLPGWGGWAGPGIKTNKRKKRKYVTKAKKIQRRDDALSNVIISESANDSLKELRPTQLPRGVRSDNHLKNILTKPTVGTFTNQSAHREAVRPRIETRMGQRIEPIGQNQLRGAIKAEWA